jgi:hypothetical protein
MKQSLENGLNQFKEFYCDYNKSKYQVRYTIQNFNFCFLFKIFLLNFWIMREQFVYLMWVQLSFVSVYFTLKVASINTDTVKIATAED